MSLARLPIPPLRRGNHHPAATNLRRVRQENRLSRSSISLAGTLGQTAFGFAGLLVITTVTDFLQGALFIELLLQPSQSLVDWLAFLESDFGHRDALQPPVKMNTRMMISVGRVR